MIKYKQGIKIKKYISISFNSYISLFALLHEVHKKDGILDIARYSWFIYGNYFFLVRMTHYIY